jgi:WD40 repeat protein
MLSKIPAKPHQYHAFLSHNSTDKPLVEALANELEKRDLCCWLDKWNLIPGDPWQSAIEEALGQCGTCVVFFGPHGLGPWHNEEMRLAIQRRVNSHEYKLRVLPVILPGGQRARESDVPAFLQGTTWVEFHKSIDEEDVLHRLVCGILGVPPGRRRESTIKEGECPYVGLKTFQPHDAPLFFGRTAKIQEVVDRLRYNFDTPKEERFLALIGASGSGKSSLALAGIVPAIQRGGLPESAKWPVIRFRPGYRPWESLQIAVANNAQIAPHLIALPALITRPEDEQRRLHVAVHLSLHDQQAAHRVFVLIDQFEEVFTLCREEAERSLLVDNVLYATNVAAGRTIVVLTMRADFYGQCVNYPGLRAAIADHQSLIGPLSEVALREVIETPAQLAGGEVESGLVELLLADMKGQAGALPFLQHALFELWERRFGRRLTVRTYTDMGRLGGSLDAYAEEFFAKMLTTQEHALCRQVLIDLVRPGEGLADTKKRVLLEDIASTDAARTVLKKLADARLVTTDRDQQPEGTQVELAHEALIGGWRRLGRWVNENRETSRLKERLLDSAREWWKNGRKEDFLYRGAQLATAAESFGSSEETLPKLGREFLKASLAGQLGEQEKRHLQQQRELLSARKLAETERQRAEGEAKARQRQRYLIVALLGLSILAGIVAVIAALEGISARAAEKRSHEMASQANVSLARESQQAGNGAEALAHLALALRLSPNNYGAVAVTGAMLTQMSWPLPIAVPMRADLGAIGSAQFSPDGRRILTACNDWTARLWDAASGKPAGAPMKHAKRVNSAQFSPDGQQVVTASDDGIVRFWDTASGKPVGEPMQHQKAVNSAQFSPDGRRVVTTSDDGKARLWDFASGRSVGEPMEHEGASSAQFSPDGRRVVTASGLLNIFNIFQKADNSVRLWDAETGKPTSEPMKHEKAVTSAQFSPDGLRVVTASFDGTARLWDAASGKPIGEPIKHGQELFSAQFSPDGQRVVTASLDGTARLWDAATGKAIGEPMKHGLPVFSAQFSPDGQRVVTASWDHTAREWDATNGKPIGEPIKREDLVWSAQFSPDGQRIVTSSRDGTARLWETSIGRQLSEPMRHEDPIRSARFSADGQRVVTVSLDGTVQLWDGTSGKPIRELLIEDRAHSAQFSSDGQRILTVSDDGRSVRVWDTASGKPFGQPKEHRKTAWLGGEYFGYFVTSAQFSPDGRRILTACNDWTARLWDATSGEPIGAPMKHAKQVNSAQFSPDGQQVLTASDDGTARLWDAASGKLVGEPMQHQKAVNSAEFSSDGQRILTVSDDGRSVRVWDTASGKPVGEPMRHQKAVNSAQFSPDGREVVTASNDGTARLWGAASGKPIGAPMKHEGPANFAQFSPDSRRVVTASDDGTAGLWDAASGESIGTSMKHQAEVSSAQFSSDGQRVLTISSDGTARLWDATRGKKIGEHLLEVGVTFAQFSPDGRRIVIASGEGTARLFDADAGKQMGEPMKHGKGVTSARFNLDGRKILTTSDDKTVCLWDGLSGKPLSELWQRDVYLAQFSPDGERVLTASHYGEVNILDAANGAWISARRLNVAFGLRAAQFSQDGKRIAAASVDELGGDETERVWDLSSGKQIGEPMKSGGETDSMQFSPDGQRLLTVSRDKMARLWNASTGKALGEPMKMVNSARFSPDGKLLVVASLDAARLWEATDGKPAGEPMRCGAQVKSAQFSPDGQRVVTASDDGTARLWDAATGKPIGEPLKDGSQPYSAQFSPDNQRVLIVSSDRAVRLWDVPSKIGENAAEDVEVLLLADLAEAVAGLSLETSGQTNTWNILTPEQLRAKWEKIAAKFAGASSRLTSLQRFLKWSVSDRRSRTISPFSDLTVAEWVENRIKDGTLDDLRAAIFVDPANARLAARFGRALAGYAVDEQTSPDEARRARAEADFQTGRALRLAPDNDEVKKLRDEVLKLL